MSVIPVTVFFSLGLVLFFVVLFLREQRRRLFASAERDSLLPLADEQPRVVGNDEVERGLRTHSEPVQPVRHSLGDGGRPGSTYAADHHHDDDSCGCARGERAMCAHCQHRPGHTV